MSEKSPIFDSQKSCKNSLALKQKNEKTKLWKRQLKTFRAHYLFGKH
jgi:hypothetical protein